MAGRAARPASDGSEDRGKQSIGVSRKGGMQAQIFTIWPLFLRKFTLGLLKNLNSSLDPGVGATLHVSAPQILTSRCLAVHNRASKVAFTRPVPRRQNTWRRARRHRSWRRARCHVFWRQACIQNPKPSFPCQRCSHFFLPPLGFFLSLTRQSLKSTNLTLDLIHTSSRARYALSPY